MECPRIDANAGTFSQTVLRKACLKWLRLNQIEKSEPTPAVPLPEHDQHSGLAKLETKRDKWRRKRDSNCSSDLILKDLSI